MMFVKGIGALFLALVAFSLFSMKLPKGDRAMSGLADAAVATFLVEAIFKYICGDFMGVAFLGEVGTASGGMGAVYGSSFIGGALSGVVAAMLNIVNDAPGTASTIPGMLAPFAFNDPMTVLLALGLSLVLGIIGGIIASMLFKKLGYTKKI